jgi:hypothetical protein
MLYLIHGDISATVIIYCFSLKGWGARTIQKELTDTLGSDICSQAQISRWFARFSMGGISCLDEARSGRLLPVMEPPVEHFLERFPFASACIIAMHFNVSYSTVKDILSRELELRTFFRRWVPHQLFDSQKKFRVDASLELFALLDQYSEL